MDLILINSRNIKVSLTKDELDLCGLYADGLDWKNMKTRLLMGKILDAAQQRYGFERDGSNLTVSVFPSADGGCELFVTKKKIPKKADTYNEKKGMICFAEGAEKLFCLCEKLESTGFSGASSLYLSENGEFVLVCENRRAFPSYMKKSDMEKKEFDLSFVFDYGKTYDATAERVAYICEHMTVLAKNRAVETINGNF